MATEHNDPRRYQVVHRTRYRYDAEVTASFARAFLVPRVTPHQQVLDHDVEISPAPDLYEVHTDFFGNHSHYVEIHTPHTQLQVRKSATLAVQWPAADLPSMTIPVDRTVELVHLDPRIDPVKRASYLLPSPLIELSTPVHEFASGLLDPRMPVGEAIGTVYHAIYEGFSYTQGATTVATTLPEVINARAGVCQDIAHLAGASFRAVGLPARYVSGYIETYPPPGEEKLAGSDATHNTLYPGRPRNSNRSAEILMETEAYSAMAGVGADADEGNDSPKVHRTEVILPTAPASIGSSHPDDGGVRWW